MVSKLLAAVLILSYSVFTPMVLCFLRFKSPKSHQIMKGLQRDITSSILDTAFSIKPLFKLAAKNSRENMVKQGLAIGINWDVETKKLYADMDKLINLFENTECPTITYPDYYIKPFHAYDEGNLSWKAAIEVEPIALTVHAPLFTPSRDILDVNGDKQLRDNFQLRMLEMLDQMIPGLVVNDAVDVGCGIGMSTMRLHKSFPSAKITGCDLSPYMLSVAKYQLNNDERNTSSRGLVDYIHCAGESTPFPSASIDLVSMSLVSHELPAQASARIFQEAYRILRPGGAFAFMDMDPTSDSFARLAANPFAFSAFRVTEPWMEEYSAIDISSALSYAGFSSVEVRSNSPRHRTVVAVKI